MSPKRAGVITLKNADTLQSNTLGVNSMILSKKVPRSSVWMLMRDLDKPFYLFVPTRETFTHDGTGDDTFSATYDIADSGALGDDMTVKAYVKSNGDPVSDGITSIDYDNDEVVIDHDTGEDLYVYYLPAEGNISLKLVAPKAGGALSKDLWTGSLDMVHQQNQYSSKAQLLLDRTQICPETFMVQLFYDHDNITINWHPDNKIGQFFLPYRSAPSVDFPDNLSERVMSQM